MITIGKYYGFRRPNTKQLSIVEILELSLTTEGVIRAIDLGNGITFTTIEDHILMELEESEVKAIQKFTKEATGRIWKIVL